MTAPPARRDPAHAELVFAKSNAEERVDRALNAIVRLLAGGLSWTSNRVREQRSVLQVARDDYFAASSALAMLDTMDIDCGERKRARSQAG